jgi:AraC-like DNA-binding protein
LERRIPDECFGLSAAKNWHPSNFGTLGYVMLMSSTLRTTLQRLVRFHKVISDARFGKLVEDRQAGALVFTLSYEDEAPYPRSREDAAIAWIVSVLRINYQAELAPLEVNFRHSRPECAPEYFKFFHCPVNFDSLETGFSLALEVVDVRLPSGNEELAAFNDQVMTRYLASLDDSTLTRRLKKIIVEHLPTGDATVETAASELKLSTRKLQRMLQQQGTTFIQLLNQTRKEIARQYVINKKIALTEVAFLLGFSELSSFFRSFKRWTGKSPVQYRQTV